MTLKVLSQNPSQYATKTKKEFGDEFQKMKSVETQEKFQLDLKLYQN